MSLIKDIYSGNEIMYRGEQSSSLFYLHRGVRQGCPLSPVLFSAYMEKIAEGVDKLGLGVTIGQGENQVRVPLLLFADDLVILGANARDLQRGLDECGRQADILQMKFNQAKSAVLLFSGCDDQSEFSVQDYIIFRGRHLQERERNSRDKVK